MNFKLLGGNNSEHCGNTAVFSVVANLLGQEGLIVSEADEYDALVVIGGGVMHHGSPAFHEKMQHLGKAQSEGKKTYLINSIWQNNPPAYNSILSRLNGMAVRGLHSQNDLSRNHRIGAHSCIDLSFFAEIDEDAPFTDLKGAAAVTGMFSADLETRWPTGQQFPAWQRLDTINMSWSSLVKTLCTAGLLVTDQHHAVYAACKARIPFVPVRHVTHKFSDLFETARAPIAICDSDTEIRNMMAWAPRNRGPFDRLFDWMDNQTKPASLIDAAPPRHDPIKSIASGYPASSLAVIENAKGANIAAGRFWEQAADFASDTVQMLINAGSSYFRGGNVERGAELFFEARFAAPERSEAGRNVHFYFPIASNWVNDDAVSGWNEGWAKTAEAAVAAADRKQDSQFLELAGQAMDQALARNSITGAAARQYIAARLVALYRQDLAWSWWNDIVLPAIPQWMQDEDQFLLAKWVGLYSQEDKARLHALTALPSWNNASYLRTAIADYLWTTEGAHTALAQSAIKDVRKFPDDPELFNLALKICLAAGENILAKQLIELNPPFALALGRMSAPVAEFLLNCGVDDPGLLPLTELAKHTRETEAKMKARLADRSKRIAVVGNSSNEVGSGHGMDIDASDEVVRFNQFRLDQQYYPDYGSKTSIVFAVGHSSSLEQSYGELPAGTTIALSTDKRLYQEQHWQILSGLMQAGFDVCFALAEERAELTGKLGKFASTGLTFCYYLKKLRGKLNRRDFYGFSFTDQLEGDRYNYFSNRKGSEAHDWVSERDLFEALFKD